MLYYRFKTFTTSYYFPKLIKSNEYMYGLYSAYGGKLSKIYWNLFKKFSIVRMLNAVSEKNLPFPYFTIKKCLGVNSLLSFNMGSPGVEQKISILGYDTETNEPFFAKFSQKPAAMLLTKNEINVYNILKDSGLTPKLLDYNVTEDYACMKAEYVKGKRPESREINSEIVKFCLKLKDYHIGNNNTTNEGLVCSLSHGDFCPWNILVDNGKMRLIDWELAKERPLGFDLFTYICQVSILFESEKDLLHVIDSKVNIIKEYFKVCSIDDYLPYLKAFAKEKAEYELGKGNEKMYERYHKLELDL